MLFLDPEKPLATCVSDSCEKCTVHDAVNCHFNFKQLMHFYVVVLPTFLLGGTGIYRTSGALLVVWLVFTAVFFLMIEIRVLCSHCPHYAEPGSSLKCWANYGILKLFKYRPGPMSLLEKSVLLGGFAAIWGFPTIFLVMGAQWFLLIGYLCAVLVFFINLKLLFCARCVNFACPLNGVETGTRKEFCKLNPKPDNPELKIEN